MIMKNVLLYGYGKSGKAVEQIVQQKLIAYKIYDDHLQVSGGCYLSQLHKKNILQFDTIILSPGVSIYTPIIQYAIKKSIKVMSELEFASMYIKTPMIAVTGTNGKTTTVHLICDMLNHAGLKAEVAGNVGVPLSQFVGKELDYLVVEVSSFQLEAIDKFSPKIAVLLNIDSDHLDRHKTWTNYQKAKLSIFKNNSKETFAVVNGADKNIVCRHLYNVHKFDKEYAGSYCYVDNGNIYYQKEFLLPVRDTQFLISNIDNALAMICVGKILHIDKDSMIHTLRNYQPLPHRLQKVAIIDQVTYYDDSKATNIHAVKNALSNFDHSVILLLGGQDKKLNFKEFLKTLPTCVYYIVCFGGCGQKIAKNVKKYTKIPYKYYPTLQEATKYVKSKANKGDIVLLSPACSSFDEFSSYAERGDMWQQYVKGVENVDKN